MEWDCLTDYEHKNLSNIEQNVKPFYIKEGDCILLCSDGLYGTLSNNEIVESIIKIEKPQKIAIDLIKKAVKKKKYYQDNISLIIIKL